MNKPLPPDQQIVDNAKSLFANSAPTTLSSENPAIQEEAFVKELQREFQLAQLKGLNQDIGERKKYATQIFWMVVVWLVTILTFIGLTGTGYFALSDTVLVALITSSTVNVTAFFLAVTKYLFPERAVSDPALLFS